VADEPVSGLRYHIGLSSLSLATVARRQGPPDRTQRRRHPVDFVRVIHCIRQSASLKFKIENEKR